MCMSTQYECRIGNPNEVGDSLLPSYLPPLRTLVDALCRPQSGALWLSRSDAASGTCGGSSDCCAARERSAAYCSKTWTAGTGAPSSQLMAVGGSERHCGRLYGHAVNRLPLCRHLPCSPCGACAPLPSTCCPKPYLNKRTPRPHSGCCE